MSTASPSPEPFPSEPSAFEDEGSDLATNVDEPVPSTTGPHQSPGKSPSQTNTTGPHQGT